jgi:hypothetical protein
MRKVRESDELRPEYRREDLGQGVRGKYFESYQKGTNLVLLSPDVAKVFPTEEAVNEALNWTRQKAARRLACLWWGKMKLQTITFAAFQTDPGWTIQAGCTTSRSGEQRG